LFEKRYITGELVEEIFVEFGELREEDFT